MKRAIASVAALVLLAGGVPLRAASTPVINANIFGIELCPQSVCGAAIFVGVLQGQVGSNLNAFGTFGVAVTHEALPDNPGGEAALTGGAFEFKVGLRRIRGFVDSGSLLNNGDDTFTVTATLVITSGGSGSVEFVGVLDHNVFPPTIAGTISQ